MTGAIPATFNIDNEQYPITPEVFPVLRSYLHNMNDIKWVVIEEQLVKYGIESDNNINEVVISVSSILSDTDIGKMIVSELSLDPVS